MVERKITEEMLIAWKTFPDLQHFFPSVDKDDASSIGECMIPDYFFWWDNHFPKDTEKQLILKGMSPVLIVEPVKPEGMFIPSGTMTTEGVDLGDLVQTIYETKPEEPVKVKPKKELDFRGLMKLTKRQLISRAYDNKVKIKESWDKTRIVNTILKKQK